MKKQICFVSLVLAIAMLAVMTVIPAIAESSDDSADMPTQEDIDNMTDEERIAFFQSIGINVSEDAPEIDESKKHIACIGDSITYGTGVVETRQTEAWPAVLNTLVPEDYQVLNYGLSGRTLLSTGDDPYPGENFYQLSHDAKADIYLIMLGTNDSKPYNWNADQYRAELIEMAQSYRDLDNQPVVYLLIPSKCFVVEGSDAVAYSISNEVIHDEIAVIIREVAEEYNYPVIDMYAFTEEHAEWFADGVHPDAAGNAAMAEYVASCLNLQ